MQVNFVDVHAAERTEAAALGSIRTADAVLLVVPSYGGQDVGKAFESAVQTLLLADVGPISTRLEHARKDPELRGEVEALETALSEIEKSRFLRDRDWDSSALDALSSIAPITLKPTIALFNVDESRLEEQAPEAGMESLAACALLEAEAAALETEDRDEILAGYGISEPLEGRVIAAVLHSLDLITFFVTDRTETRALGVKKGVTAIEAAGYVHTDMQRGFIRAEVAAFEKVGEAGSWEAAKESGVARVEGKDYVVSDGDVLRFRFSV